MQQYGKSIFVSLLYRQTLLFISFIFCILKNPVQNIFFLHLQARKVVLQ